MRRQVRQDRDFRIQLERQQQRLDTERSLNAGNEARVLRPLGDQYQLPENVNATDPEQADQYREFIAQ